MSTIRSKPVLEGSAETQLPLSADAVWAVLTDFEQQADWIPTFRMDGTAVPGAAVTYRVRLRKGTPVVWDGVIEAFEAPRKLTLRWKFAGLFSVRQQFELTPTGQGCRLVHTLSAHGLLTPLFPKRRTRANLLRLAEWISRKLQARCFTLPAAKRGRRRT